METASGKRECQPSINAATSGVDSAASAPATLFKVFDFNSGMNFLIDTGSQISILPASTWDKSNRSRTQELMAANGTTIDAFGQRLLSLRLGKMNFKWSFAVAAVTQPILGADFLCAHALMVDMKGWR